MHNTDRQFCRRTRREFLWDSRGRVRRRSASPGLLHNDKLLRQRSPPPKTATVVHQPDGPQAADVPGPKAKAVIFLFMYGGPSQVDTFDHKPELYQAGRQDHPGQDLRPRRAQGRGPGRRPQVGVQALRQVREAGQRPVPARRPVHVDDIAFVHSMYAESPDPRVRPADDEQRQAAQRLPVPRQLGDLRPGQREPEPARVRGHAGFKTGGPISGPKNWSSGYMPAASTRGCCVRADDRRRSSTLQPPPGISRRAEQRAILDRLKEKNEAHAAERTGQQRAGRPHRVSYELAFKMQSPRPGGGGHVARESQGDEGAVRHRRQGQTDDFGRKCLLARRLVERGVRFVQMYSGGSHNDDNWDAHTDIKKNHDQARRGAPTSRSPAC